MPAHNAGHDGLGVSAEQAGGAVILANALGEGMVGNITRFPTGLWPLISFRKHVRIGQVGGPVFLALSLLLPRRPRAEKYAAILWGVVPIVLNGLSDINSPEANAR